MWGRLWPEAAQVLSDMGVPRAWAMTTESWMVQLLLQSGFENVGCVVAYGVRPYPSPRIGEVDAGISAMQEADLREVGELDRAAFSPPWQLDPDALGENRRRSDLAVVLRRESRIAGYLTAVRTSVGVHLSRIAVHPRHQGRGAGRRLLAYLLDFFHRQGAPIVTVNTQTENLRSQRLYREMGFSPIGGSFPVFRAQTAPIRR